jgi:hypothetical protein
MMMNLPSHSTDPLSSLGAAVADLGSGDLTALAKPSEVHEIAETVWEIALPPRP